ncbi:MAG TPA: SCO2322 family protein [Nocardioidaceae bacterium]|nr:SCO2322 family protein [Nocardioidaceae bacterium]
MATLLPRRVVGAIITFFLAAVSVSAFAAPAHAEEGYQYWNYFHLEGDTWAFSQVGPADYQPKDGDVEGFRYGTSTTSQGIEPRADLSEVDFDAVCGDTEAAEGEKRVAVLVDYGVELGNGTPPEPRAQCAVVDEKASTQDILGEVAEVRVESGMTCALDGYPASGCGEPVKDAEVPAEEEPVAFALPIDTGAGASDADTSDADTDPVASEEAEDGTTLGPVLVIALVVVLIAVAALLLTRRNKKA